MAEKKDKKLPQDVKEKIDEAVKLTVKQYGDVLIRLSKKGDGKN